MKITVTNPYLSLVNEYLIDSPAPANINYLWNFGSLLGLNLIIVIISGITLAMHYNSDISLAFASVEHITRDVNFGWLIRFIHMNTVSFFFVCVYIHIGKGLYYSSYKAPRTTLWIVGVVIFICMMAELWPNWWISLQFPELTSSILFGSLLPFNKTRTPAIKRIGPHDKEVLSQIICGLLGDWGGNRVPSKTMFSYRFEIDQEVGPNGDYMHWLSKRLFELGYCSSPSPKKIKRAATKTQPAREFLRLSLFTFTSFDWIYNGFYGNPTINPFTGKSIRVKRVPLWIGDYLNPAGLAAWIMQDGSKTKDGLHLATQSFTKEECIFLADLLTEKFGLKTSVVKTGAVNQWRIYIWKESLPILHALVLVCSSNRKL